MAPYRETAPNRCVPQGTLQLLAPIAPPRKQLVHRQQRPARPLVHKGLRRVECLLDFPAKASASVTASSAAASSTRDGDLMGDGHRGGVSTPTPFVTSGQQVEFGAFSRRSSSTAAASDRTRCAPSAGTTACPEHGSAHQTSSMLALFLARISRAVSDSRQTRQPTINSRSIGPVDRMSACHRPLNTVRPP